MIKKKSHAATISGIDIPNTATRRSGRASYNTTSIKVKIARKQRHS
jgi:hypothetical protein